MSRVLFTRLNEADTRARCAAAGVAISAIEVLPDGGTRLVCNSRVGAATMAVKLKSELIKGTVDRTDFITMRRQSVARASDW